MVTCLIYLTLLCVCAGLGLLLYSEGTTDTHKSLFCFYVGLELGFIAVILLFIAALSV